VNAKLKLATSDIPIEINGITFNRGNIISEYDIHDIKFNEAGEVSLSIKSSGDNNIIELISLEVSIDIAGDKLFYTKNQNGIIDNFVATDNLSKCIITNVKNYRLDIYVTEKAESKFTSYDYKVLLEDKFFKLIVDNRTNFVKALDDKNNIYNLKNNYII
jgi:GR25 family glycosyltransferase involved in LPS biosynthesis